MSDRLSTTANKRQNSDSTFKVSPFQARGFGVQPKSDESSPATKAQLWENYQQAKQLNQSGANSVSVPIQTKLTIGQPGDKYEQEADSVADRVMAMSEPAQVQREELPEEEELQMKPLAETISPLVQREELPEEEELQMKQSSPSNQTATPDLESQLGSSKGGGNPLSDDVRSFMEPRFGADFSGVRMHTGSDAVQMNQGVNAQAFAHGSDIYFGAGKAPGKDALTAHELTHVVQQTGASPISIQQHMELVARKSIDPTQSLLIQRDDSKAVDPPSLTQPEVPTTSPKNPVVAAMWSAQVNEQLGEISKLLIHGGSGAAQTAHDRLMDVQVFIKSLVYTHRDQGKVAIATLLAADLNTLISHQVDIGHHLGKLSPLEAIAEEATINANTFQAATKDISREGASRSPDIDSKDPTDTSSKLGSVGSLLSGIIGGSAEIIDRANQQQVIAMMWQSGVVVPEQNIAEILSKPKAGKSAAKTALARTNIIQSTLGNTLETYPLTGDRRTANKIMNFIALMMGQEAEIRPHLGVKKSLSKIGLDLNRSLGVMVRRGDEL